MLNYCYTIIHYYHVRVILVWQVALVFFKGSPRLHWL